MYQLIRNFDIPGQFPGLDRHFQFSTLSHFEHDLQEKFHMYKQLCIIFYCVNVLTIFRRFPTAFRIFPMIMQKLSEGHTNVPNISQNFPKIAEDVQEKSEDVSS